MRQDLPTRPTACQANPPRNIILAATYREICWPFSRFCQLYLAFKSKLAPTMSCRPNSRNGYGRKSVLTETGKIELEVPRDRLSTFDPQLIAKYQRRFPGFDEKIVSMYARGMSVRDLC